MWRGWSLSCLYLSKVNCIFLNFFWPLFFAIFDFFSVFVFHFFCFLECPLPFDCLQPPFHRFQWIFLLPSPGYGKGEGSCWRWYMFGERCLQEWSCEAAMRVYALPIPDINGSQVVDVLMGSQYTFLKNAAGVWYAVGYNEPGCLGIGYVSAWGVCRRPSAICIGCKGWNKHLVFFSWCHSKSTELEEWCDLSRKMSIRVGCSKFQWFHSSLSFSR